MEQAGAKPIDPATASDVDLRAWFNRRWSELDSDYQPHGAVHREIATWVAPQRASFLLSERPPADALLNPDILDDTAVFAGDTASAGLTSGMMSSWRPWFLLTTPFPRLNDRPAARAWLYGTSERLHWVALMTNLYTEAPVMFLDETHFGTSPLLSFEDDERFLRFEVSPAGSYRLAAGADRRTHTFMRETWMTVEQLVEEFGYEACSDRVKRQWDAGGRSQGVAVRHAILKNPRADRRKDTAPFKPWADVHWERDSGVSGNDPVFLRYGGFNEFPVMAARWAVRAGEVWGTGPGYRALGHIKSLQTMAGDGMDAVAKYIDPPMKGPTSLKGEPTSLLPAGLTLVDETKGTGTFSPAVQQTIDLAALDSRIVRLQTSVQRSYHEDLFRLMIELDRPDVKAAEIYERRDERLSLLAPTYERNSVDVFTPLVERLYAVAERRGLIDPPPPELDGVPLRVKYLSIMAIQLAALASRGIVQYGREIVQYAAALGPGRGEDMLAKVNWMRFADRLAEMRGVPPDLINSELVVARERAARMQQQRAQAALAAASSAARTARDLSAAKVDDDSVLSRFAQPALS